MSLSNSLSWTTKTVRAPNNFYTAKLMPSQAMQKRSLQMKAKKIWNKNVMVSVPAWTFGYYVEKVETSNHSKFKKQEYCHGSISVTQLTDEDSGDKRIDLPSLVKFVTRTSMTIILLLVSKVLVGSKATSIIPPHFLCVFTIVSVQRLLKPHTTQVNPEVLESLKEKNECECEEYFVIEDNAILFHGAFDKKICNFTISYDPEDPKNKKILENFLPNFIPVWPSIKRGDIYHTRRHYLHEYHKHSCAVMDLFDYVRKCLQIAEENQGTITDVINRMFDEARVTVVELEELQPRKLYGIHLRDLIAEFNGTFKGSVTLHTLPFVDTNGTERHLLHEIGIAYDLNLEKQLKIPTQPVRGSLPVCKKTMRLIGNEVIYLLR